MVIHHPSKTFASARGTPSAPYRRTDGWSRAVTVEQAEELFARRAEKQRDAYRALLIEAKQHWGSLGVQYPFEFDPRPAKTSKKEKK